MKIVLIGDSSVGKSALVHRFTQNQPLGVSKATVGIAFFKRTVNDPETGEDHAVQIWDTAGQEKFQSVTTHHYRAADGALLVFDITNEASFHNLDRWLNELHENTEPSVQVILVGSKVDLSQKRAVSEAQAQAYALDNDLLYAETSAVWDKTWAGGQGNMMGVERVFLTAVQAIIRQQQDAGSNPLRLDMTGVYGAFKKGGNIMLGEKEEESNACDC